MRLVPAALVAWAGAGAGVGMAPVAALGGATLVTLGALAAGLLLRRTGRRLPGQVWLALACGVLALCSAALHVHVRDASGLPALALEGGRVDLTGRLKQDPRPAGGDGSMTLVELEVETVHSPDASGNRAVITAIMRMDLGSDARQGAQVRVEGDIAPNRGGGPFAATVFADRFEVTAAARGYDAWVGRARERYRDMAAGHGDPGALLVGMTLGDASGVSPRLDADMRASSLTHLTAVSGAHIAIVLGATGAVVGALTRRRRVFVPVGAAALAGLVALVGPLPSVLRAVAMGTVTLVALLAGRRRAALPALSVAVTVLVLIQPWLARSFGMALSVVATAALIVVAPRWAARLARIVPVPVAYALAVPAAAQAACTPLLVVISGQVAMGGVLANLAAAPAVAPATILGLLGGAVAHIDPALAHPLAWAGRGACAWIAAVATGVGDHPWAAVAWPSGVGGAVLATVAVAVVVAGAGWLIRTRRRAVVACAILVAAVALAALPAVRTQVRQVTGRGVPGDWAVVACDVGQGTAWAIRTGSASAVLIDTGPPGGGVGSCLEQAGVATLDAIILTHLDIDHVGDLAEAAQNRPVGRVIAGVGCADAGHVARVDSLLVDAGLRAEALDVGAAPIRGVFGQVHWSVLAPPARVCPGASASDGSRGNEGSLVGVFSTPAGLVVTLGDLEPDGQRAMRPALIGELAGREVAVVSVAHHGSPHQLPALARDLAAPLAIISAGRDNDYGHPAPATIELYEQAGGTVVSTHECGTIAVRAGAQAQYSARCP